MNKPNLANIAKNTRMFLTQHSPEILGGFGTAGLLFTTVLAVRATPTALRLLEDVKRTEHKDSLTVAETVKATWKCYIPAAVTGVASIGCLIGSCSINASRNAALAAAYKLSETALNEYRDKVVEVIGEKKDQIIKDEINKDRLEKNPVQSSEVYVTEKGNTLCYDHISGRYFRSDINLIRKAENELNRRLITDMYASLNEFYDLIGLDHISIGYELGWNLDGGNVEIEFGSHLTSNDEPCLVMDFGRCMPRYAFSRFA